MKYLLFINILSVMIIGLWSCNEGNEIETLQIDDKRSNIEEIDLASFDETGLQHNEELKYLLEHLPASTTADNFIENTQVVLARLHSKQLIESLYWYEDYSSPVHMLQELKDNGLVSEDLYNLGLQDFHDLEEFTPEDSMEDFVNARLENMPELSTEDRQRYLNFLSTLKHSFNFWNPKGENGASYFNLSNARTQNWVGYELIKRLIAIAEADSVTSFIDLGGMKMPITTFNMVQSGYFHFNRL